MQVLDDEWTLTTDPTNCGRAERWFAAARDEARPAAVPGCIQQIFPNYHGVAWYWRNVQVARTATVQERYLLRFSAVDYLAEVWLNGVFVGGHEGADTPFCLDLTGALRPGGANLLAVRVLNPADAPIDGIRLLETPHRNKAIQNYQPGRSYNIGGIVAPVELLVVPALRIGDLFAQPDPATGQIRVAITVQNDTSAHITGRLSALVEPSSRADRLDAAAQPASFAPGATLHELSLSIARPHMWDLHDPYLYRVEATLDAQAPDDVTWTHRAAARCGFRDFRLVDGYFRLNGRRVFLRSTHTGNHYPMGISRAQELDFVRRDLIYAKASGFNMVRFISGMALAEQLDFCDEIGLMVQEESLAGWLLADSPHMAERYDRSTREMILRDRNHPSLTIWGMLNETFDGPVFRHAVAALALVRALDPTRLVLLSSGRWDAQPGIGSAANPGSAQWEHVWGIEAPGAAAVSKDWGAVHLAYISGAGDAHIYPPVPHLPETTTLLRTIGRDTKPVFLSEYGIGSLFNAIREYRMFEQDGARTDMPDAAMIGSMADRLVADWQRFGMDAVYAFPEDMLRDSQRLYARQRLLGFDLIRSNPKICGYNLTGMLDHALTGEGVWTFWREWKPAIMDALADGWAPLRWCLFVDPLHGYAGRTCNIEAVLANEDVLKPGEYPVRLRVIGPLGVVWEKTTVACIPQPDVGQDGPLAVTVLCEDVTWSGPAGLYTLAATMERGGAAAGGRLTFHISDAAALPRLHQTVTLWGIAPPVERWLEAQGVTCQPFERAGADHNAVILVGDPAAHAEQPERWIELAQRIAQGSTAIFLSPPAFTRGDDPVGWLPLAQKGRCYAFHDWLYHKECVSKAHPVFAGLQAPGVMDWDYYGQVIPHTIFDGQATPDDVMAAAFAVGYSCPGGYAAGVLLGAYRFGAGRFVLNTLRVLEQIEQHPAADRLLLNLISTAAQALHTAPAALPDDFAALLEQIGYR
jgi:Glycosyl hydrolases family 2, sugar binding domain/Glycosyl hydrolases family 2, TIM barrel domain/Glycosyl hydrolases family 2